VHLTSLSELVQEISVPAAYHNVCLLQAAHSQVPLILWNQITKDQDLRVDYPVLLLALKENRSFSIYRKNTLHENHPVLSADKITSANLI